MNSSVFWKRFSGWNMTVLFYRFLSSWQEETKAFSKYSDHFSHKGVMHHYLCNSQLMIYCWPQKYLFLANANLVPKMNKNLSLYTLSSTKLWGSPSSSPPQHLDPSLTRPRHKGVVGHVVVQLLSWTKTGSASFSTLAHVGHGSVKSLLFICIHLLCLLSISIKWFLYKHWVFSFNNIMTQSNQLDKVDEND